MTHLYDLTGQMIGLRNLMEDGDVDPTVLQDTLDGLTGDIEVKAEGLLGYVANISADAAAIDAEIKRLQARKIAMTNQQRALRDYLKHNMISADIQKITCPLFSVTLIKPKPMVAILDKKALPDSMVKTTVTVAPIKADILKALKAGLGVSGATLGESDYGLLIK